MLTEKQLPYTGPYGLAASSLPSYGSTPYALKRCMSRLGLLTWEPDEWDLHYNTKLAAALSQWDPGATGYGPGRCEKLRRAVIPPNLPHAGEYAADSVALQLIQDEYKADHSVDPALEKARAMLQYDRAFTGTYKFGGGHGMDADDVTPDMALDCSSSTSKELDRFDLLGVPDVVRNSTWFETWGLAGRGKYVTVHANAEHVWTEFRLPEGYFRFDTSPHGDGSRGPRVRTSERSDYGFVHRHPPGL